MILTKQVEIKISSSTIGYWNNKGYTIPTHIDSKGRVKTFKKGVTRLLVNVADLPPQSNVVIEAACVKCSLVRKLVYHKYTPICWACNLKQQKGVDHPKYLHRVTTKGADRGFDLYLRRMYNITAIIYYELFRDQDYKCAICKCQQAETGRKFAVDHCHKTGSIRGLLCQHCNTALGLFRDSPTVLEDAISYLTTKKAA